MRWESSLESASAGWVQCLQTRLNTGWITSQKHPKWGKKGRKMRHTWVQTPGERQKGESWAENGKGKKKEGQALALRLEGGKSCLLDREKRNMRLERTCGAGIRTNIGDTFHISPYIQRYLYHRRLLICCWRSSFQLCHLLKQKFSSTAHQDKVHPCYIYPKDTSITS